MDQFRSLVEKIIDCHKTKGRAFIAVSGLGGSGKTTLSKKLIEHIPGSTIIHVDDFYKTEEERSQTHGSEEIISNCFDWDRMDKVFGNVRAGRGVCYQKYNWEKNIREGWVEMDPQSITILEGIYCLQDRFLPHYDLAVWVDAPRDIRMQRVLKRDPEWKHPWWNLWMDQDDRYVAAEKPHEKAHLIYSGL